MNSRLIAICFVFATASFVRITCQQASAGVFTDHLVVKNQLKSGSIRYDIA